MPSFQHLLLTTTIFFLGGRCRPNLHNHKSSVVCEARREPNHHPDDPPYHDDDSTNNNNYEYANSSSHPSKLPEIDPLSDGILLRPLMTYNPQLQSSSSSSSLEDKWVMFDFRPIFPPYSMEKVNDALVVRQRQRQQQQQQQQQEEEAEKEKEEEIEEMFEKKEENVSVAKTMSEREDDHDEAINEGRTSISASLSSSSSSSSMAVGEEEEERVTTKTITERNDSNPMDAASMADGEEEIEMIHSSATFSSEKPREADHDSERIVDKDERGIQEGMGAVGDDEGDEAITATATATTSITNHSKASTSITDEETDNEEDEKTIENGPKVALIQSDGDDDGDDDDEKNTNTITNVNANATIQSTEDNHHVKSKNIDNDQPLPIVDENTKESTGGTWSSHDDDETKPMAKDVPVVHANDASHDSEQDDHDENNVDYATKEIEVDEHQQQQQEGHEQQQYEMLDESKTNEGDSDENEKEIAAEPETLPITEGDGNGNLADGMQSSLPEAEHDSLSTDASSDAESWDEDGEFGQTPQEQEGKEPERISLRGERQQKQQQLENDVPVTSSPLEEQLQNDAATQEAIGDIHDNSKDYPNTDDSLDRVLSMLDDIKLPDTTIPLPPSSSSSASGESSSTNANREFVTGLDEIDKLFESVSPPDELDVGADGQSIQEVLTSQGIKIIAKRARGAWKDVRGWFENSVQGALPQWRVGGKGGREDGGKDDNDDDELEDIASLIQSGNGDVLLSKDWSLKGTDKRSSSRNKKGEEAWKDKSGKSVQSNNDQTTNNGKKESGSNERKQDGENNRGNKMQEKFPLLKTKQANKLWKFAQRKWKQAKHILDDLFSIFDLNDDDEEEDNTFDLSELNLDNIQSLIGKGGDGGIARGQRPMMKGEKPPNFDGKFGSAVDESFLKQRYEAMMKLQDDNK